MTARLLTVALLALPLSLACGDKDADDSGGAATGIDGGTADGGTGDAGTTDGSTATVSGKVVMGDGSAASVQMRLCAELCRSISTEADGTFEYLAVDADHYALEAVYLADQKNYATPLDLITVADGQQVALADDIVIYAYETVHDLGDKLEMVELDGGMTVMADPSVMVASDANSPFLGATDPDYVSSVQVDPSAIGLPLEEIQGQIVGAWFMGRLSVSLSVPWAFTIDDDLGLAEGTTLKIYAADYDNKHWSEGGAAMVSGGKIMSDDGAGIPVLSTVLLVQE